MQVSVPPLVEVMRGEPVTLDCKPLGAHDHFELEWFLVSASGLGSGRRGSESQGAAGLQEFILSSDFKGP